MGSDAAALERFDTFYARALLPAARLGHLLTGSAATGHDVAQDALASMHARWNEIASPDAYLRAAVVNRARSTQRRWLRERAFRAQFRPEPVTAIPDFDDAWRAICRLPMRQRAVIVLRFYEDLSVLDIARILDVPPGTVKSTLHRALRQLEGMLS